MAGLDLPKEPIVPSKVFGAMHRLLQVVPNDGPKGDVVSERACAALRACISKLDLQSICQRPTAELCALLAETAGVVAHPRLSALCRSPLWRHDECYVPPWTVKIDDLILAHAALNQDEGLLHLVENAFLSVRGFHVEEDSQERSECERTAAALTGAFLKKKPSLAGQLAHLAMVLYEQNHPDVDMEDLMRRMSERVEIGRPSECDFRVLLGTQSVLAKFHKIKSTSAPLDFSCIEELLSNPELPDFLKQLRNDPIISMTDSIAVAPRATPAPSIDFNEFLHSNTPPGSPHMTRQDVERIAEGTLQKHLAELVGQVKDLEARLAKGMSESIASVAESEKRMETRIAESIAESIADSEKRMETRIAEGMAESDKRMETRIAESMQLYPQMAQVQNLFSRVDELVEQQRRLHILANQAGDNAREWTEDNAQQISDVQEALEALTVRMDDAHARITSAESALEDLAYDFGRQDDILQNTQSLMEQVQARLSKIRQHESRSLQRSQHLESRFGGKEKAAENVVRRLCAHPRFADDPRLELVNFRREGTKLKKDIRRLMQLWEKGGMREHCVKQDGWYIEKDAWPRALEHFYIKENKQGVVTIAFTKHRVREQQEEEEEEEE
jgi:hypothetical protein